MALYKLNQHVSSLVPFSQAILASALFHALSGSSFGIKVSHDYVVVTSAVGEKVVSVFIYLLYLLIGVAIGGHVDLDALELVPLVYSDG